MAVKSFTFMQQTTILFGVNEMQRERERERERERVSERVSE